MLAIPPQQVPTEEARAALPAEVPLEDAVHNVAHASLLVLGIARDDFSLIGRGLADRLHQPRRAHLYPRSMELLERAEELGAIGATISGAGPTVLFWCTWQQTGKLVERAARRGAGLRRPPGAVRAPRRRREGAVSRGGPRGRRGGRARRPVCLVHRPRYDDWSLPKGKLDPGEGFEEAALREVEEETGLRCRLGDELPEVRYTDSQGPPEGRPLLAMEVVDDDASRRTTRWTSCAGSRRPRRRSCSPTSATASSSAS